MITASRLKVVCLVCCALALASPVRAKNLGVRGAVFVIKEPDLLSVIAARLARMNETGELEAHEKVAEKKAQATMMRPPRVEGITSALKTESRQFDPSIVLERDIADHRGVIFARAGTLVNPLAHVGLRSPLFFINGDSSFEVRWALAEATRRGGKIILVDGSPVELMRAHKRPFYFDQGGNLSKRFSIRHSPSVVEQDGQVLKITEVGPS